MAILASNLTREYLVVDAPLQEIPTLRKMMWRFGLSAPEFYDQYAEGLAWTYFLKAQLFWIGRMSVPHILIPYGYLVKLYKAIGAFVLLTSLVVAITQRRILITSLVVSGLCWALPMRHFVAFHDFQSIFYIGIPLVFFSLLALLTEKTSKNLIVGSAGVALLIFSFSNIHMNISKAFAADTEKKVLAADFQRIADYVGTGRTIFVDGNYETIGGAPHAVEFYLAGNYFQQTVENAEFILSRHADENHTLLSSENERVFLYKATKPETSASTLNKGMKNDK
jgi:hypothetical protein